ncbi:MAG: glycine cleavage system aminomethyltransferase GcvT [Chitinivibrionales bacterium]|nr:glycine cleavage system aminomethyltransferase GcvT [Chitinivibrionales bacterium]
MSEHEQHEEVKKTIFNQIHRQLHAKMSPFGGFEMPIQYEGIIKEHIATREAVGMFDTCHMGEFQINGPKACQELDLILSCSVSDLKPGQCRYGFICNEQGGVIDDQIIYRIAENQFYMVVNAATQDTDFEWVKSHCSPTTEVSNVSAVTAKIDVQGPKSPALIKQLVSDTIEDLKFYTFKYSTYKNTKILLSRTGYTGEIGFEIFCPNEVAISFWNDCIGLGAKPAGLGCRDTLRLESGLPLYGHELNDKRNPIEAGFMRAIATTKKYIGSEIILNPKNHVSQLMGLVLEGRSSARSGDSILSPDGKTTIGIVTSGSFAPSLQTAIAVGYVKKEYAQSETPVVIATERKQIPAVIRPNPLYTKGTVRKPIADFLK